VSKRDDDSQTDMEVGMTTAERRRRRRRGGGLRVPSDNVPRRSATPPVVAPVPEDPSLAMSIAYSFSSEATEPAPRASRETVPSFDNHEAMPTVIDPVSGPVEQADFDMKTREMTAVDLEALGLSEAGISSSTLPIQRMSSPGMDAVGPTASESSGGRVQFTKRGATEPVDDDVDVEIDSGLDMMDSTDGVLAGRSTLARGSSVRADEVSDDELSGDEISGDEVSDDEVSADEVSADEVSADEVSADEVSADEVSADDVSDDDVSDESDLEPTQIAAIGPLAPAAGEASQPRIPLLEASQPRLAMPEASQPRAVMPPVVIPPVAPPPAAFKGGRAPTVALSEDDLEEVREAARLATAPPSRSGSMSLPPPMPATKPVEAKPRSADPPSVPEIDIMALDDKASGEFEVDVEGIVDVRSAPVAVPASPAALASPASPAASLASPASGASLASLASLPGPAALPEPRPRTPSQPPPSQGHSPAAGAQPLGHGYPPPSTPPPLAHGHPLSTPPGSPPVPRDSQPMPIVREPHASPPPPPVAHKAPPSPPPGKKDKAPAAAIATPGAKPDGKPARGKPWFVDLFDEDYLRTLPFLTPQATQAEAEFAIDALGLTPGAQVLDVGCGYGRHAMELAARGFHVVGLDMSTPLLVRGGEEAHRRGLTINFVRGDMREFDFEAQFDGAYCLFSTFGYFDDETNKKTISNIARALRPGGRVLIEILNRDYVIADLPTRVWWEGDGCVVLEEVDLNYFSSRIQVNRSVVFDDGRQLEQEISVRAYSLHEVGKLLHAAGFRVLEVSGAYHTRGRFFGNQSRHIIVLAERKDPAAT